MILQPNGIQQKVGVAIDIWDKLDFKTPKMVTRNKDGHFKMMKEIIHQKDMTFITIYASNVVLPKYIMQLLTDLNREIDSNAIIVGDLNTPLILMY